MLARLREVWWVGLAALAVVLVTFWSSASTVELLTLLLTAAALSWFSTVPAERLVNSKRKVSGELSLLTVLMVLLVGGAALLTPTSTLLLALLLAVAASVVGLVRAVRHGLARKAL